MRSRKEAGRKRSGKHDSGYRRLFSHAQTVEELIRGFLREPWTSQLDFSTLERVETSFVSDDLLDRRSDIIWRVRWKGKEDGWFYLYLLLEFQSTSYHFMAVRLLTYVSLLLEQIIRTERVKPGEGLPPVLPLVLYNGRRPWRAPLDLASLFVQLPDGLRRRLPTLSYQVLDENRLDLEQPGLRDNRLAALLRIETCRSFEQIPRLTSELSALMPAGQEPELRRTFNVWLRSVLRRLFPGVTIPGRVDLEEVPMLEETSLEWRKKFLKEGRKEGRQEGRQEGLEQGIRKGIRKGRVEGMRELLLHLLSERFGAVPKSVATAVEEITTARELERLAKRVLKASSLAELELGRSIEKRSAPNRRS
jgi:predicted transposase YdaD